MNTSLSPRDIQTRIRAGESLEDVGRLAGIPLDRVERFAAPVLAEREHIAAVAHVRLGPPPRARPPGTAACGSPSPSGWSAAAWTSTRVTWDSYRLDDGRWAVTADYRSGDAQPARLASPSTRAAGSRSPATTRPAGCSASSPGRGSAAGPAPTRPAPRPVAEDTEPTVDLSDELALVRATREPVAAQLATRRSADEPTVAVPRLLRPVADLPPQLGGDGYSEDSPRVYPGLSDATAVPETGLGGRLGAGHRGQLPGRAQPAGRQRPADPQATPEPRYRPTARPRFPARTSRPPRSARRPSRALSRDRARAARHRHPGPPDATVNLADRMDEAEEFETESMARAAAGADRPARRKRATVPSWDEIMFGGPKRSR